eukprot:GHVT01045312.1.p1 GENE.GHVT01045312.1~~GHVT01045312.1.p1  ORF type:complete len:265 (-),score=17.45 GHVT01045312.1:286-1080(-)
MCSRVCRCRVILLCAFLVLDNFLVVLPLPFVCLKCWMQPGCCVSTPMSAKLVILLSPCGPYFPGGYKPIRILASTMYGRAFPGGVGDVKAGGNYAPTVRPTAEVASQGYSSILWLHPCGQDYEITEAGVANFFMLIENDAGERELVTPAVERNLILPGVMRDSIIKLAKTYGDLKVTEKPILLKRDLLKAVEQNKLIEAFATGTAAVITPIEGVAVDGKLINIPLDKDDPTANIGKLANKLLSDIQMIQYGMKQPLERDWIVDV